MNTNRKKRIYQAIGVMGVGSIIATIVWPWTGDFRGGMIVIVLSVAFFLSLIVGTAD